MSSNARKPTILIVPGAWHHSTHFDGISSMLRGFSYPIVHVDNPSSDGKVPPKDLSADIANIRSVLATLVDQEGKDVVMVMHSFGGVPGSASVPGFEKTKRMKEEKVGGVIAILYIAAFAIPKGTTVRGALGGTYPEWHGVKGDIAYLTDPHANFYSDLTRADSKQYVDQLMPQSLLAYEEEIPADCLNSTVPRTYLMCTEDNALPLSAQEAMVQNLGKDCIVEKCDTGHSPFLSQPEVVVRLVRRVAGEEI